MDRLKTFLKYILWGIGLIILSEILINVGLNSDYRNIERKDAISQINIYQSQANLSSGRIRGIVTNNQPEVLNGKYMEFSFFSERNVLVGRTYVKIKDDLGIEQSQPFEILFKANDVANYDVKIVSEKKEAKQMEIIPKSWQSPYVIITEIILVLMFI